MGDKFGKTLLRAQQGDRIALARALSMVEQLGAKALEEPLLLRPRSRAFRVGITGPPGAGKSTLVGALLPSLLQEGLRVGVLAVDPSSPFSRGAVLGDRIRYGDLVANERIFVRSLGTRGSLGGLCASAYLMLRVFDACGFDMVLVETVGVGQTELEVMYVADLITVVLVPESGDSIQAMKAGLLEIADLFVVNKADRPGADSMGKELEWVSEGKEPIPVVKASALRAEGVGEILEHWLERRRNDVRVQKAWGLRSEAQRLRHEALALIRSDFEGRILDYVNGVKDQTTFIDFLRKAPRIWPDAKS